ncbi:hypothetical protein BC937DRAFT_94657 [Endogone sp. FLAS-F59071]|nr:hypothetical protein BC937DRAFT_94657 [Endogone sp. FLAS-F59071]|eukprot:RUS20666.1 hypothetical protein BC937DRAFT_94657 [Endogone sp. FLAS-F59071]
MASTPHFVLEFFFPNLTTLHQYLATNINQNSHLIVQDDDNPDYKQFLFTTLIGEENKSDTGGARAPGAKVRQRSFPRNSIREDGMKQNEIRCETGHGGLSGMSGLTDIENHFPNTLVNEVKSRWWSLLLERIGDTAMIYILTYTAVFLALPNGSYCQITGTPISELPLPSAAMNSTVRIRGGAFQPPICGDDGASRRENAVTRMDRSEQAEETEVAQPLNSGLVKVTKKRKKNNADLFPGETLTLAERSQKKRRMGGTDRSEDAEHRPTIVTGAEAQARSKEEVDTILDRGEIYIERPQKKKRRMDDMERTKDDEHRMSVAVGTDVQAKLKEEANIIPDEAESQLERPQKKPRVGGIAGSRDDEHHLNLAVSVKLQAKSRRKKWRAISDGSEIKIERLQKKGTGSIREFKDSKRRPSSTVVAEIRATSRNKEEPDEISDGSKSQTERSQKKQRLDGTRRLSEAADNEGCQTPTGCEEPQAKSRKNKQKRKRQNEVRDDEAASGGNNVEKKGRDSVIVGEADGSRKKRVNLGEITVGDGKNKRNERY